MGIVVNKTFTGHCRQHWLHFPRLPNLWASVIFSYFQIPIDMDWGLGWLLCVHIQRPAPNMPHLIFMMNPTCEGVWCMEEPEQSVKKVLKGQTLPHREARTLLTQAFGWQMEGYPRTHTGSCFSYILLPTFCFDLKAFANIDSAH